MSKKEILKITLKYAKKFKFLPIKIHFYYFKGKRAKYLASADYRNKYIEFNLKYSRLIDLEAILHELGHFYYPCYYGNGQYDKGFISEYHAEKFMLDSLNKKQYKIAIKQDLKTINSKIWNEKYNLHQRAFTQLLADKGELYE